MFEHIKDKTVLYIEDEKDVRESTSEILEDYFRIFHTASSAEEAYEVFDNESIDILLVDIELSEISGLMFIEKIKQRNHTLPIVIISAYTKTEYLLKSIELNLLQYIVKPLTSTKIDSLLNKLNDCFMNDSKSELTPGVWLDKRKATISFDNEIHELTKREYMFLAMLNRNNVVFYNELHALWDNEIPSENAIRSFVKYLRKKLPKEILKNRNGYGYYIK
jgi:DNA-binding response OmpR family regulator